MKIDIKTIDTERFHINERTIPGIGDVVLVVPHKAMWKWEPGEEHLRSLLCRPDGTVISAGLPKFFNFGENRDHDLVVLEGLRKGKTQFVVKEDGSLIIRSVIDGKVHFRTRGSEQIAEDMRDDVMELIHREYPYLLDPSIHMPESSLLMEYVGPRNQIVVRYERPALVALGWVDFGAQDKLYFRPHRTGPEDPLRYMPRPALVDLPAAIDDAVARVRAFSDQEGVVSWTWIDEGMDTHLCKFKSAWYLRLHSLRTQATPRYMREFCFVNGIRDLDGLKRALLDAGFDWEVCTYLEPLFDEFKRDLDAVETSLAWADRVVERLVPGITRKEAAMALTDVTQGRPDGRPLFAYMMAKWLGERDKAQEQADALRLGMAVAQYKMFKRTGIEKLGSSKVVDDG